MDKVIKEGVNLIYKDDKISVIGETFKLEGSLPSSELTKLYMNGKGRTVVTLTVETNENQPETKPEATQAKITISELIDELANKGLSEEEIMKTEVTI